MVIIGVVAGVIVAVGTIVAGIIAAVKWIYACGREHQRKIEHEAMVTEALKSLQEHKANDSGPDNHSWLPGI
jgi:hypothetical protein